MLKMKYRKTYKTKKNLYVYLLHLFGPPMCSELEFSKSTYLHMKFMCISKNEKYRSGRVTVMRFDVFGAFLKLEMNTFVC